MSTLAELLRAERDQALAEAGFERGRAEQAMLRNQVMRHEAVALRKQLRALMGENQHVESDSHQAQAQLEEQLRLAMDTNWRLERERGELSRAQERLRAQVEEQALELARLRARVKALQGQLKL